MLNLTRRQKIEFRAATARKMRYAPARLNFSNWALTSNDMRELVRCIIKFDRIDVLDLSHNLIDDDGLLILANLRNVIRLNLSHNHITPVE